MSEHFSFFQQQNQAAGRTGDAPAAPATQTATQAPSAPDPAAAAPKGAFDPTMIILLLMPIALVFFMTRSQTKKQKELESSLKVGDKVITRAGMLGKVVDLGERYVKLEIAPGVNIQVVRSGIEGREADVAAKDAAKDGSKDAAKDKPAEKGQEKKA